MQTGNPLHTIRPTSAGNRRLGSGRTGFRQRVLGMFVGATIAVLGGQAEAQEAKPYSDPMELVADMLTLLSNPLNADEFEDRLRRKGLDRFPAQVTNIVDNGNAWLVRIMGEPGPNLESGFFCLVRKTDSESVALLKKVSAASPWIEVAVQVAEYEVDTQADVAKVIFDPCRVISVRGR